MLWGQVFALARGSVAAQCGLHVGGFVAREQLDYIGPGGSQSSLKLQLLLRNIYT